MSTERALDRLRDVVSSRVHIDRLGAPGRSVHLAHLQLVVTIEPFEGESVSIAVDGAGAAIEEERARLKCAHEMLERLVGTSPVAVAAHTHFLCRERGESLAWQDFTPYPESGMAKLATDISRRFPSWCRARGMLTGRPYQVPASKVFPAWRHFVPAEDFDGECDSSGLAAGVASCRARCQRHGLCEVLERDALMLAWRLPGWPVYAMGTMDEAVPELAGFFRDHALEGTLLEIGDPSLAPVVLCVLTAPEGGVTCGSACDLDVRAAATRSALEAVMLWNGARTGNANPAAVEEPICTSLDHVRYGWSHPEVVVSWFDALPRRAQAPPPAGLTDLADRCRHQFFGAEPLVVDLDLGEPQPAESYVCRVLQPHACRKESSADMPFVGGRRFTALLAAHRDMNRLPHPYG